MKVHYITCAQSSSLDAATNQLSLFHILDEIRGSAFPLKLPTVCVASLFEREPDDSQVSSFVLAATLDGALLASFTMQVDFSKSRRNRSVNTVRGLTIPAPGLVTISIVQKAKVLAEWRAQAIETGDGTARKMDAPQPAAEPQPAPAKSAPTLN